VPERPAPATLLICTTSIRSQPIFNFRFSIFLSSVYDIPMAEHIEDIQHRYVDLKKRMELVRSYL
jgi:hypothetical protein